MSESHQLVLKKPVSKLNSVFKIDLKAFFSNAAKFTVAAANKEASDSVEYGISTLKSLGAKAKPEQVAWQLVISSFLNAFTRVVEEYKSLLKQEISDDEITDLDQRLEHQLTLVKISIDSNFFNRPQDLSLFEAFQPVLTFWLGSMGLDSNQAASFQYRLKEEFPLTLHEVWGNDPEQYKCIVETLNSPFKVPVQDRLAWKKYSLWLQKQANNRVFDEAFGLREVYIPLRSYYETKEGYKTKKHVCDLHSTMIEWLNPKLSKFDKYDSLKVISGGPGSGKSSFAKVLAAEIIEQKIAPVLFIPLHHFNLSNNLIEAVGDFVNDTPYLRNNPLHQDFIQDRLILIFDGLDELSEQGQAAKAAAEQFVDSLVRELDRKNDNNKQWQAIITGRDLSVQDNQHNLKKPQQILHLLPYRLKENEVEDYTGNDELIKADQCSLWWRKFGQAKGIGYTEIPSELDKENLFPITKEPLLNYLVALSYERKKIDFNDETSLNKIYYDLLQAVYERNYADGRQHTASKHLTFEQFLEVLEEIALAVWHSNGRTASESYLVKRCEEAGVSHYLEKFSESAKKGVVKLLTAFYFREFETNSNNDRTFEFTHKSFGEYLAARHIIKSALDIQEEVFRREQNHKKGWSDIEALEKWIHLTGATIIDTYLFSFIKNEIKELGEKKQTDIQTVFVRLLNIAINNGSPMETFRGLNFAQMLKHSANAEAALLAVHFACAIQTSVRSELETKHLQRWFLRARAGIYDINVLNSAFQYLNIPYSYLSFAALLELDFSYSNLDNSTLSFSILYKSNFTGASLKNSDLEQADLGDTKFINSCLIEAILRNANLENANLENTG